jgi:8-oxo-dGTP pyrophosphatase MutT (NUDIX family)
MEEGKKEKKKETSTGNTLIRRYSAGGVVFKKDSKKVAWLLIRPKNTVRWQFPKGMIDKEESSREAAVREVCEEGGVEAQIIQKVGSQSYFYYLEGVKVFQQVEFYLMRFVKNSDKEFDKKEIDEVKFLPYKDAFAALTFDNDKKLLMKAKTILEQGVQDNLI